MRWMLACLGLAACGGGAPPPPAHLEPITAIDQTGQGLAMVVDATDRLVLLDSSGVRRLVGNRLDLVPGTQQFAFGSLGLDRDGTPLLASSQSGALARLPSTDVLEPVGPMVFNPIQLPVGTPAGNYYVRVFNSPDSLMLAPGAVDWVTSPLDLSRTLRGEDGTLYAIVDGDIVTIGANDAPAPIATCTEFGGGACGALRLAGFDAGGQLYLGEAAATSLQVLDPGGAIRDVDLPGELRVVDLRAGVQFVALIASDPDRADQLSLWLVSPDDTFARIATLAATPSFFMAPVLAADHAGAMYVAHDGTLDLVVPD